MANLPDILTRNRRDIVFFSLVLIILVMLPSSLAAPDGPSLALIGLLVTCAAMLLTTFHNFGMTGVGRLIEMIGFGLITFALLWLPLTHQDAISVSSYNGNALPGATTNLESVRSVMSNPELTNKLTTEVWIRHMLPPRTPSPCYIGDVTICSVADQVGNLMPATQWDGETYLLALLSALSPAITSVVLVWGFTRHSDQLEAPSEPTGEPVNIS